MRRDTRERARGALEYRVYGEIVNSCQLVLNIVIRRGWQEQIKVA